MAMMSLIVLVKLWMLYATDVLWQAVRAVALTVWQDIVWLKHQHNAHCARLSLTCVCGPCLCLTSGLYYWSVWRNLLSVLFAWDWVTCQLEQTLTITDMRAKCHQGFCCQFSVPCLRIQCMSWIGKYIDVHCSTAKLKKDITLGQHYTPAGNKMCILAADSDVDQKLKRTSPIEKKTQRKVYTVRRYKGSHCLRCSPDPNWLESKCALTTVVACRTGKLKRTSH